MIIDEAIYSLLSADPGIAAIVADRITPVVSLEGGDMPALTYLIVDSIRAYSLAGPSGVARARVQFDSWGNHYLDARRLADAVRKAVSGFKGQIGGDAGVTIEGIFIEDKTAPWEPQAKLYRAMQEAEVTYVE